MNRIPYLTVIISLIHKAAHRILSDHRSKFSSRKMDKEFSDVFI